MNELFAPPGNAWQSVSPKLATMRRVVLLSFVGVTMVAVVVVVLLFSWPLWLLAVVLPCLLVLGGLGTVTIGRNARAWGYAERDEDLYVTHGATFKELIVVPYGRMQFVDVTSGPVERYFGLSKVHLHTASPKTNAQIPGLPPEEAARLRDRLTGLGESQAAGL